MKSNSNKQMHVNHNTLLGKGMGGGRLSPGHYLRSYVQVDISNVTTYSPGPLSEVPQVCWARYLILPLPCVSLSCLV